MTASRLTVAQALVRAMAAQWTEVDGERRRVFAGVWAIFGHGNVAALGEALYAARDVLPTLRAHNEQAMGHAAVAFAKASYRRRMMACTTSIGPGATNLATAAAVAHVNRLPVLLLPGDVFATRGPDPVLQQLEDFSDGLLTANDCLRPLSRYFDRITRAEQLVVAFNRAMQVLTDPASCGPVTLALCQDVQAEALGWPASLFEERSWGLRRSPPAREELARALQVLRAARRPLIVCGGGVLYSEAGAALREFCERHGIPSGETQAGKSALPASHPLNLGGIGVTGTAAANVLAADADVVLAVGTRLQDFTTGSATLFRSKGCRILALNVQPLDTCKHGAVPLIADAREGLRQLSEALGGWRAADAWTQRAHAERSSWRATAESFTAAGDQPLPSDAQVIGAVQRAAQASDILVGAAGGLPGELHKHWQAEQPAGYHLEYGFSCMGYEIAGALGVKLAHPRREVIVMVGDGSYLMLNSEIATSVRMGLKLIIVLLDNGGFGCIERLQGSTGNASFNNMRASSYAAPDGLDFVAHARSLGALASKVTGIAQLAGSLAAARKSDRTSVLVIDTDPARSTAAGGHWWDVAVPEVSDRAEVRAARERYTLARQLRTDDD
ncbi:MAG: 3D-(3,5/4)-trihydroxycyclohexane-1,2-dione acylhydrolase (decyclizing) [Gammaproteobacteria bacterium]|nr:MAG: 3D-(3,5/4)-trihydroxycyclohexane-1,2-dione acylhydrolase (decyclizing) [Gammaproteobacteria bacterium]